MAKKLAKKKKDYDKDGKVEAPEKEYKGAKSKAIAKAIGKKKKKAPITESEGVVAFINAISSKNYARANKYLHSVIEDKLQQRISASLNEPLF